MRRDSDRPQAKESQVRIDTQWIAYDEDRGVMTRQNSAEAVIAWLEQFTKGTSQRDRRHRAGARRNSAMVRQSDQPSCDGRRLDHSRRPHPPLGSHSPQISSRQLGRVIRLPAIPWRPSTGRCRPFLQGTVSRFL